MVDEIRNGVTWSSDWNDHTTDPGDGREAFRFWWDDMRSTEVYELVVEAFERGRASERKRCAVACEEYERTERETSEFYRARGRPDRVEMHDARAFVLAGAAVRIRALDVKP